MRCFRKNGGQEVQSWLSEIKLVLEEWERGGDTAREGIFDLVNTVMQTLAVCWSSIYCQYAKPAYETLCNE